MMDLEIIECPDVVKDKYSFESAIYFFRKNRLFNLCQDASEETVKKVTKRINGGYNNLDHRIELTKRYIGYI